METKSRNQINISIWQIHFFVFNLLIIDYTDRQQNQNNLNLNVFQRKSSTSHTETSVTTFMEYNKNHRRQLRIKYIFCIKNYKLIFDSKFINHPNFNFPLSRSDSETNLQQKFHVLDLASVQLTHKISNIQIEEFLRYREHKKLICDD